MFQTSSIVCRSIHLTDELKIGLEYDIHGGLLNIFVKNTSQRPSQINVLSNQYKDCDYILNNNNDYLLSSSEIQQDSYIDNELGDVSYREDDEPKICIELSNIYVYDLHEQNENDLCQTMITSPPLLFPSSSSSSTSSSCFDEQTIDNDDGYSTHSLDDTEQQQSISIPSSKLIIPFVPYHDYSYPEEYVSSIRRLMEQLMWLSPFKKTVKQMMINHFFH